MVKLSEIDWENTLFVTIYHILLLVLLPIYLINYTPSFGLLSTTLILVTVTGLGITAGYHRFYSHRSYRAKLPLEIALLFLGTLGSEGDVIRWSHDHRLHHKHVDKKEDPYNITKGFWHAHFIWFMLKRKEMNPKVVSDLMKNKLAVLQAKYYTVWLILANILVVSIFGFIFKDFLGAFVFLVLLRMFLVHHSTWFINSLAHYWGSQPFSKEHTAVNNHVIAFLTLGEGFHNYHHTFERDYRNGVRWYQFDPTKLLLWIASKLGLAKDLKRVSKTVMRKRMLMEDKRLLLEKLESTRPSRYENWKENVITSYEKLAIKLSKFNELVAEYRNARKERRKLLKLELGVMKKNIKIDFKAWSGLCDNVLRLTPA